MNKWPVYLLYFVLVGAMLINDPITWGIMFSAAAAQSAPRYSWYFLGKLALVLCGLLLAVSGDSKQLVGVLIGSVCGAMI